MKNKITLALVVAGLAAAVYYYASRPHKRQQTNFIACGVPANRIRSDNNAQKFVADDLYKWTKRELKVFFTDTREQAVIDKTMKIVTEWSRYCSIRFKWTTDIWESDIRVTFHDPEGGYQSCIGRDAENYPNKTTLWLSGLDTSNDDAEFKRVTLHEFGHALGLLHELQSPVSTVQWDTTAVYKYYDSLYRWTPGKVDSNIFFVYTGARHSRFDPASIMVYAVPAHLTRNGKEIPWPNDLSQTDQSYIKSYYK